MARRLPPTLRESRSIVSQSLLSILDQDTMKLPFSNTRLSLIAAGKLSRRQILQGGAATGLVVVIPACGADDKTAQTTSPALSGSTTDSTSVPSVTTTATPPPPPTVQPPAPVTPPAQPPAQPPAPPPANPPSPPATTNTTTSAPTTSEPPVETDTGAVASSDVSSAPTSESSAAEDSSGGEATTTNNGELTVPAWDAVPVCTASKTDGAGQGPFFIHNEEKTDDIDLYRQDIRGQYNPEAEEGTEMHLHLRILDSTNTECEAKPVAGIEVYIWHTDPQGYYSGFGNPGDQKPDEPYAGVPGQNDLDNTDRFCRGAAITDENGVISFRSYFPGWYNGRDLHIHFVALKKGSASRGRQTYTGGDHLFTTQFYFDPGLSDQVHKAKEPYLRRTKLSAYQGAIAADEQGNSGLHAKATYDGSLVVAQMQILLDPKA